MRLVIDSLRDHRSSGSVEVVERKGMGHPDTLCDALAERLSRALCRHYLERFGTILHHNVDKALLVGGRARVEPGGGEILEPIEIILAGRAVTQVANERIPVEEIAIEEGRQLIRESFRELDPERHVRIRCLVRPGSADLAELFGRRGGGAAQLANDSSFGVGFAPLTPLELLVLELDRELGSAQFRDREPCSGEDTKIMAVRVDGLVELTVARAMIARHVPSIDHYVSAKRRLAEQVKALANARFPEVAVSVNAADDLDRGSIYLTVTGTSAESGDDGQVGRGNRITGLITPQRPMTLEAAAGKNPVNHVGKLYNLCAQQIAERIVAETQQVDGATCVLVSCIGSPIERPQLAEVRVRCVGYSSPEQMRPSIERITRAELAALPELWKRVVRGELSVF
jgi:S-adenosylmethionine synthetase